MEPRDQLGTGGRHARLILSNWLRRQRRAVGQNLPGVHLVEQAARTLQLDRSGAKLFIERKDTPEPPTPDRR